MIGKAKVRVARLAPLAILVALAGAIASAMLVSRPAPASPNVLDSATLAGLRHAGNVVYLREIARSGDSGAQEALGELLLERHLDDEGLYWLTASGDQGDLRAMWSMVVYYNLRSPPDHLLAEAWAARYGTVGTGWEKFAVAEGLRTGTWDDPDPVEAMRWYLAAGDQRVPEAYLQAAELYASGDGTPRNLIQAYAYVAVAAPMFGSEGDDRQLHQDAVRRQKEIAAQLSPADLAAAERRAADINRHRH